MLAISFIAFTSFKAVNCKAVAGNFKWFKYLGYGDPNNPANYSMVLFAPECNSTYYLCAVYAECDFWSWHPTSASLFELSISSGNFTQTYNGPYGQVKMESLE